jgi:hypothetical protein
MGKIERAQYATWSTKVTQQFPVPEGMVGIKGIFIRGANLSKVFVQSSDGIHQSTIPARDVATEEDDYEIEIEDFVVLNWRLDLGRTISLTPTTSTPATANVYVLFARSLDGPRYQIQSALFDPQTPEPFDLVDVPDGFSRLEDVFIRGLNMENVQISLGGTKLNDIPCRDIGVDADTKNFSFIPVRESVAQNTKIRAVAVDEGAGTATDGFFRFS